MANNFGWQFACGNLNWVSCNISNGSEIMLKFDKAKYSWKYSIHNYSWKISRTNEMKNLIQFLSIRDWVLKISKSFIYVRPGKHYSQCSNTGWPKSKFPFSNACNSKNIHQVGKAKIGFKGGSFFSAKAGFLP